MYTNADSLENKVNELKFTVDSLDFKPNIIAITEAKSKNKKSHMNLSEFNLHGYNTISNDMDSESNSRGIIVYIEDKFDYSIIECRTNFKEYLVIIRTLKMSYIYVLFTEVPIVQMIIINYY